MKNDDCPNGLGAVRKIRIPEDMKEKIYNKIVSEGISERKAFSFWRVSWERFSAILKK